MAIVKLPVYVKLEKDAQGKMQIGQTYRWCPTRDAQTLAVLKFDLEIDEDLFMPAMDMNTTITVQAPQVLSKKTIVAESLELVNDVKKGL